LTRDRRTARYRRRKPIPAIALVTLLIVAAVVVWIKVINQATNVNAQTACPAPANSAQAGTPLPHNALDKVTPQPAGDVKVRVLNASTQRGAAQQTSIALTDLGFQQAASPASDPLYPNGDMKCQGEIRFGANGVGPARTLSLVLPCTQLVRDNRQDGTVDLAIGSNFSQLTPTPDALAALKQLASWAAAHPNPNGGQQAQGTLAPQVSPALLSGARAYAC
jgi:hypothetical protein